MSVVGSEFGACFVGTLCAGALRQLPSPSLMCPDISTPPTARGSQGLAKDRLSCMGFCAFLVTLLCREHNLKCLVSLFPCPSWGFQSSGCNYHGVFERHLWQMLLWSLVILLDKMMVLPFCVVKAQLGMPCFLAVRAWALLQPP